MSLPADNASRKALPVWDGCIMYFPDVWAEITKVSVSGNEQHKLGPPVRWVRGVSMDQMNTAFRHMHDRGVGVHFDTDGQRHLAKAIWRLCAQLQLDVEAERDSGRKGKGKDRSASQGVRRVLSQASSKRHGKARA